MPALSGIVKNIYIKNLSEPDRFGNLHRCGFKIGEELVSWGTTKKPEISYKEGENYKTLQNGMEVEFMYKQNGDYKNISKTSLSVISTEGAQATPPPSAPAQQQAAPAYKKPYVSSNVNPAMRGQAMNMAAHVLKYSEEDFTNQEKITYAIKWYLNSVDDFDALWAKAEKEVLEGETKVEKPKPTSRPIPTVEDSYDDEI